MWTQTSLWIPLRRKFDRDFSAREYKTKREGKIPRASESACVSTRSVGGSNKDKPLKLGHQDISRALFQERPRDSYLFVFQRKIDRSMVKAKLAS